MNKTKSVLFSECKYTPLLNKSPIVENWVYFSYHSAHNNHKRNIKKIIPQLKCALNLNPICIKKRTNRH